jgi:hypothetical protein
MENYRFVVYADARMSFTFSKPVSYGLSIKAQELNRSNIIFSIIENSMEIESSPFTPMDETCAHSLSLQSTSMQGSCSLSSSDFTNHTLRLIGSALILDRSGEPPVYLELTFDAKF